MLARHDKVAFEPPQAQWLSTPAWRERIAAVLLDPGTLGLGRSKAEDLRGGTPPENAALLRQVLEGEIGARRDVVLLNAAAAVMAAGKADEWAQAIAVARESLDSGRARQVLGRLIETSKMPSPSGGRQGRGA